MAIKLLNRAKMDTTTTGTGTITLTSVANGFQSFTAAGAVTGDTIRYVIEDGDYWEIGTALYNSTGPTLTRSPLESSSSGSALNLSGSASVFASATADDLKPQTYTSTSFTATSGQTTFTVSHESGLEMVFLNGVMLLDGGTDYTANGSTIVLATGATTGDLLLVIAFKAVNLVDLNATDDFGLITGSATILDDFGSITGS